MDKQTDKQIFLKKLGQRIVQLREAKGWTQSDLAMNCDKERQSIERVENGKTNPTAFYLKQIAEALEVSMEELFKH